MSKKERDIQRFLTRPRNYTLRELETLLGYFEYTKYTSKGSGIKFYRPGGGRVISFHAPHGDGDNTLPAYIIQQVRETLEESGDICV